MYINWIINYILVGLIFQWILHWGTQKISSQNEFTHKERITIIFVWPIGVVGFILSFIKSFFLNK
jgi:hypothetical protein